jgi:toxin YoeB
MRLVFTPQGWDDYVYWQTRDRAVLKRINRLVEDTVRHPTEGIGKPEQLKYGVSGAWSRRITEEHRLVYLVRSDDVVILQARYRYTK